MLPLSATAGNWQYGDIRIEDSSIGYRVQRPWLMAIRMAEILSPLEEVAFHELRAEANPELAGLG
jgi:hypothetical protein